LFGVGSNEYSLLKTELEKNHVLKKKGTG